MTAKNTNFSGILYYNPVSLGFNPIASATLTCTNNPVNEGQTNTFNIVTWNIPDGTTLYWQVNSSTNLLFSRFDNQRGTVTVTNNRASFTLTVDANNTTAPGAQYYSVAIGKTFGGTDLAVLEGIIVNDTSQDIPLLVMDLDPKNYEPANSSTITVTVTYSNIYAGGFPGGYGGSLFRFNGNIPTQPSIGDTFVYNGTTYTVRDTAGFATYGTEYQYYAVGFTPSIDPENIIPVGTQIDITHGSNGLSISDASGQSHPGTLVGTPTFTAAGSGGNGNYFTLNGSSQYITVPTLQNSTYRSVTMSLWFNSSAGGGSLITKELSYKMRLNALGRLNILASTTGLSWQYNTTNILDTVTNDEWHHVAVSISPTFIDWYLDGVRIMHEAASGAIGANTQPLMIGSFGQGTSEFFTGLIGSARLYNYALTSQEVIDYYNATKSRYQLTTYTAATSSNGTTPGSVYFLRASYPGIENVPVGATMTGPIFPDPNAPVTITVSQAWNPNQTLWYVNYDPVPVGTQTTTPGDTFVFTW